MLLAGAPRRFPTTRSARFARNLSLIRSLSFALEILERQFIEEPAKALERHAPLVQKIYATILRSDLRKRAQVMLLTEVDKAVRLQERTDAFNASTGPAKEQRRKLEFGPEFSFRRKRIGRAIDHPTELAEHRIALAFETFLPTVGARLATPHFRDSLRALTAVWADADRGGRPASAAKRPSKWVAAAALVRAAGLGKCEPDTLRVEWQRWQTRAVKGFGNL